MKRATLAAFFWQIAAVFLATACEVRSCSSSAPERFAPTLFRTGNSLESYEEAKTQGIKFAESDFRLTADGVVVSTHDRNLGGNCGRVDTKSMADLKDCTIKYKHHVATLSDFLEIPLEGWFLDLKDTESKNESNQRAIIEAAMAEVDRAGLKKKVVLMVYNAPADTVEAIRTKGFRAGMKGYPKNKQQTMEIVDRASKNGFEMVCVNIDNITPEVIDLSARKGVWHLAWDLQNNEKKWGELAEAGLGGVITRDPTAAETASKRYQKPKNWTSPKRHN